MKDYILQRVNDVAEYILQTNSTFRDTAKKFGVSKSTIHKDMRFVLPKINPILYEEVSKIIDYNKYESYIRGGLALRNKYEKEKG